MKQYKNTVNTSTHITKTPSQLSKTHTYTHPHTTKPTLTHTHHHTLQNPHTHTHSHITKPTHIYTHTLKNLHIHTHTHTHTHTYTLQNHTYTHTHVLQKGTIYTSFTPRLEPLKWIRAKFKPCEFSRIHPNIGWCPLGFKNIIFCGGQIGPL